jgi:hypothetical protein
MLSIDFFQQIIYTLALSLLLVYLSQLPKRSLFFSSLLFILLTLGVNFIPILRGSSLVELVRGVIGDVSTASGVLLVLIILNQFDFSDKKEFVLNNIEKISISIIGLLLYLSTFGFFKIDFYSYGYLSWTMLWFISGLSFLLMLFNRRLGLVLMIALLGFYLKLQSSNNLWDYLLDPVLWLVLLVNLGINLFSRKQVEQSWQKY